MIFFFTTNPNLKNKTTKKKQQHILVVGMDGQTNRPKPNCSFNFFEVGDITMHKCTRYGPYKLNL